MWSECMSSYSYNQCCCAHFLAFIEWSFPAKNFYIKFPEDSGRPMVKGSMRTLFRISG